MKNNPPLLVLDLSRILAGPLCSMYLGDLGAQVIKVESFAGDDTRTWGPPFFFGEKENPKGESAYFLSINRNKKSLAVDLRSKDGQEIVQALANKADVIIENFKVGSLTKFGLDYPTVQKKNKGIVYCSISGYGQFGPEALTPGYDFIVQGESGLMSITGEVGGDSMKTGVAISDVVTGYNACIAILMALFRRQLNGCGDYIDVSLLDCSLAALVNVASNVLISQRPAQKFGNDHPNIVPYGTFTAQDKSFNIAIGNDRQFADFAQLVGKSKWTAADQYATNQQRVIKRKELIAKINQELKKKPADYWIKKLKAVNIPTSLVYSVAETLEMSQILARKMTTIVDHPWGKLPLLASPLNFKNQPINEPYAPPPLLGQHSCELIKKYLDRKQEQINRYLQEKVIYQNPMTAVKNQRTDKS